MNTKELVEAMKETNLVFSRVLPSSRLYEVELKVEE